MKRNFVNSHQCCGSLEDAKLTHKYNSPMEDYSDVQKECDYKKRKLHVEKQKKKILLDEVRFLRQRHAFLTKLQMEELGSSQSVDIHDVHLEMERNCIANVTRIQESSGRDEVVGKTMTITDKPMNFSTNEKKSGKKKVSWNENVAVRII